MATPILVTKLFKPPIRPEQVPRPRPIERLNAGLRQNQGFGRKLTLISAPAGFGKTTLVSEWIQAMGRATPPIAVGWLSLDEGDNDPKRFLLSPPPESILTALLNDITTIPEDFVLVLNYLLEEVLRQQPESVQTFLLRTYILDRLCGPLCDAVVLDPFVPGQETLEYLRQAKKCVI
ncbi:MAG: hypothetical protein P8X95_23075 [Anaerolineales bacterium]|jgi:ATP/maltotriose-dependent transcriptional regulator MalT